jgi:hypothetical protein
MTQLGALPRRVASATGPNKQLVETMELAQKARSAASKHFTGET